jgi:hypothetical protein
MRPPTRLLSPDDLVELPPVTAKAVLEVEMAKMVKTAELGAA